MTVSLKSALVVVLAVILVDVFCGEIARTRTNSQNREEYALLNPDPSASQKPSRISVTQNPRKWIQQNNIWIRNEQASSNIATNSNRKTENVPKRTSTTTSTTAKPILNRGNTYTVLKPQVHENNRQQALINGLNGNQHSSTTSVPTNKPLSYADAAKSKLSPNPVSPNSQAGSAQKNSFPSAGPLQDTKSGSSGDDAAVSDSDVTDDELREFSETLLRKDSNNAMKYVTLNLQGMTTSRSPNDEAPLPLFKIDNAAFQIPSIEKLVPLYNNYFLDSSQNEVYTGQERIEENNLLDSILATPVMQFARSFLIQKGRIGKDPKQFKDLIRQIWFNMYSRGQGRIGSSGFEHVFLAEIKNNQVSGLHNWIFFNEEESQKRANYLGYLKKLDLGDKGAILKYHFTFHDIDKPVGSMFIGTSPELELALYSTCFVLRADKICPLKMNGNRFIIRTYTYRYRGKNMIGSAFPEI